MTVSLPDFRTRFPEFAATADGLVTFAIEDADSMVGDWGADRDRAVLFLSAHYLAQQGQGSDIAQANASAEVAEVKVGDVTTKFKDTTSSSASHPYAGSLYGRRFWEIAKVYSMGATVV